MADTIQKKMQNEIDVLKKYEKESETLRQQRQQLNGQLNENEVVKTELEFVTDTEKVYKLIGKVFIEQDLVESKQNVAKRMDYIKGEIKRIDNALAVTDMKKEDCRTKLTKLQQEQIQLTNVAKTK